MIVAVAFVALAALITLGGFRTLKPVKAQDQVPPSIPDRISFGMVGITSGQTARINVSNTSIIICQRVVLSFRNSNGQLIRNRSGEVIRRSVELQPGDATFLDLNYDELPPGPIRQQLRAVIPAILPPVADSNQEPQPIGDQSPPVGDRLASTVEVIANANGRTVFALSGPPAIQKVPLPTAD
jgi:hypothetical protein